MSASGSGIRAALSAPPFSAFCAFKTDEPPRRGQLAALCGGNNPGGCCPGQCDGDVQLPVVEPYGRSAAGVVVEPAYLRTPTALEKSMHFLVHNYLREPHSPVVFLAPFEVWRYLWDRMRQVRTNWVPQLPPVGSEMWEGNDDDSEADGEGCKKVFFQQQGPKESWVTKRMVWNESRRRLRWLEFTVAALAVGGANLCRSSEGCKRFIEEKQNFLESIAQCFSDLVVSYRAEQRLRSSEMFSAVILFYGLSQLTKIENRAGFFRVAQVSVSFSSAGGADPAPTFVFEPPSNSVDFGSVYRELAYIPCMARSRHVRIALKLIHCWCNREWFRFFYLCRTARLTVLQRALLTYSFSYARFRAVVDLVTANVIVYGKVRVRGFMAISELAEQLLLTPARCVELLITMGLENQLCESQSLLRLARPDAAPYITQEEIYRHLEETSGKVRLCLPTVPSFVGFTVWHRALELFPNAFENDLSTTTQGTQSLPITSLENMRCPVNLMQLLEPYCPPYNKDVAELQLKDAGNEWFNRIQASRKGMLAWCAHRIGQEKLRHTKAAEGDGVCPDVVGDATADYEFDNAGEWDYDNLDEEQKRIVSAMDRESVSTRSSIFGDDSNDETSTLQINSDDEKSEDGGLSAANDEDICELEDGDKDVLRSARLLLDSLCSSSIYQTAGKEAQEESVEAESEGAAEDGTVCGDEDVQHSGLSTQQSALECVSDGAPSPHDTIESPTTSLSNGEQKSASLATEESLESSQSNCNESSSTAKVKAVKVIKDSHSAECHQSVTRQEEAKESTGYSWVADGPPFGSLNKTAAVDASKNVPAPFENFSRVLWGSSMQQPQLKDDEYKPLSRGPLRVKRVRTDDTTTDESSQPSSPPPRGQESQSFSNASMSPVSDRIMLLPSELEEEEERKRLEEEARRNQASPRQRMRVEHVERGDAASPLKMTSASSGEKVTRDAPGASEEPAATGASTSYKDAIRAHMKRRREKGLEEYQAVGSEKCSFLQGYQREARSSISVGPSSYTSYYTISKLLQSEPSRWLSTLTSYLIRFYTDSYHDVLACRYLSSIICCDPRARDLTGWLCRGFSPSMVSYNEEDEEMMSVPGGLRYGAELSSSMKNSPLLHLSSRIVVFGDGFRVCNGADGCECTDGATALALSQSSEGANYNVLPTLGHRIVATMFPQQERAVLLRKGAFYGCEAVAEEADVNGVFRHDCEVVDKTNDDNDHIGLWEQLHVLQPEHMPTGPDAWQFLSAAAAAWRRSVPQDAKELLLKTQVSLHAVDFRDASRLQWAQSSDSSTTTEGSHPKKQLTAIIALDATREEIYNEGLEALRLLILRASEHRSILLSGVVVVIHAADATDDKRDEVEELFWSTWERGTRAAEEAKLQGVTAAAVRVHEDDMATWRAMYQNTIRRVVTKAKGKTNVTRTSRSPTLDESLPSSIHSGSNEEADVKKYAPYKVKQLIESWRAGTLHTPAPSLVIVSSHPVTGTGTEPPHEGQRWNSAGGVRGQEAVSTAPDPEIVRGMLDSAFDLLLRDYELKRCEFLRGNICCMR